MSVAEPRCTVVLRTHIPWSATMISDTPRVSGGIVLYKGSTDSYSAAKQMECNVWRLVTYGVKFTWLRVRRLKVCGVIAFVEKLVWYIIIALDWQKSRGGPLAHVGGWGAGKSLVTCDYCEMCVTQHCTGLAGTPNSGHPEMRTPRWTGYVSLSQIVCLCTLQALAMYTFFCPKGVRIREVPLYTNMWQCTG
jgi:hypothetical protein